MEATSPSEASDLQCPQKVFIVYLTQVGILEFGQLGFVRQNHEDFLSLTEANLIFISCTLSEVTQTFFKFKCVFKGSFFHSLIQKTLGKSYHSTKSSSHQDVTANKTGKGLFCRNHTYRALDSKHGNFSSNEENKRE